MKGYVLTVERVIRATPEAIFDILSDASKHPLIDGSGMLQGTVERAPEPARARGHLRHGDEDGDVVLDRQPSGRIRDRIARIAWQTGPTGGWGQGPGRTDLALRARTRSTAGPGSARAGTSPPTTSGCCSSSGNIYSGKTRRDMERTLARLDDLVAAWPT